MAEASRFTILLIGEPSVGKTSIMLMYTEHTFSEDPQHPQEQFQSRTIAVNADDNVIMRLKDTQGFENFRGLTSSFCRGAKAILFIFDVTNKDSLTAIPTWVSECAKYGKAPVQALIGNKIDLPNRVVSAEDARKVAKENGLSYFELSAKTEQNLDETFKQIAVQIMTADKEGASSAEPPKDIALISDHNKPKPKKNSSGSEKEKCIVS